ncbi:unnamed protein product, partial [Trichogramma brassicae]
MVKLVRVHPSLHQPNSRDRQPNSSQAAAKQQPSSSRDHQLDSRHHQPGSRDRRPSSSLAATTSIKIDYHLPTKIGPFVHEKRPIKLTLQQILVHAQFIAVIVHCMFFASAIFGSAPFLSSNSTAFFEPESIAKCSGVQPFSPYPEHRLATDDMEKKAAEGGQQDAPMLAYSGEKDEMIAGVENWPPPGLDSAESLPVSEMMDDVGADMLASIAKFSNAPKVIVTDEDGKVVEQVGAVAEFTELVEMAPLPLPVRQSTPRNEESSKPSDEQPQEPPNEPKQVPMDVNGNPEAAWRKEKCGSQGGRKKKPSISRQFAVDDVESRTRRGYCPRRRFPRGSRPGFTRSENHITLDVYQVGILYFLTTSSRKSTGFYLYYWTISSRKSSIPPASNCFQQVITRSSINFEPKISIITGRSTI